MSSSTILSDNGVTSGSAGIKSTGGSDGTLLLQTTTAGGSATTAVTVDNAQNVGIGTTSPSTRLHVFGDGAALRLQDDGNLYAQVSTDNSGNLYLAADVSNGADSSIRFLNDNTERARIDSSGRLLVGATSGGSKLTVAASVSSDFIANLTATINSGNSYGVLSSITTAPNDTVSSFFYGLDSSAGRFIVRSNGGIANYSANNVNLSDRREKTNFAPAKSYLDVICAIPVQTYNYIDQNLEEDDGLTLGVVAQDVQVVAPELVTESDWSVEKDGSKMRLSIYQTDMQYALMKCIQELKAELDTAKEQIAALQGAAK